MQKEHPIIFSTPMVQAILEGRKTMTRRIVKYPSKYKLNELIGWEIKPHKDDLNSFSFWWDTKYTVPSFRCKYGKPEDLLWVRETHQYCLIEDFDGAGNDKEKILYKANPGDQEILDQFEESKWRPPIHMPKAATRLWLKIKSIKGERLQEISEKDAKAEGIMQGKNGYYLDYLNKHSWSIQHTELPIDSFKSLWKSIHGEESWDSNPWVWVIDFERIKKP